MLAPLKDAQIFSTARVGERGRWIEWPNQARPGDEPLVEIDADALYEMGMSQRAVLTIALADRYGMIAFKFASIAMKTY